MFSFWYWFGKGSGSKPGYQRLFDKWLVLHVVVGALLAYLVPVTLGEAANTVLLPLAGILIGLSFAWGGNAQALLATEEIESLSEYKDGGFEEYVYTFMLAILLILGSLVAWGIAGMGVIDRPSPFSWGARLYPLVKGVYYLLASMTIRECWQVVFASQMLLVARKKIREAKGSNGPAN